MEAWKVAGIVGISVVTLTAANVMASGTGVVNLTEKEKLGKNIFFDDRLSNPAGQACSDCHSRGAGFNGIGDANIPVYQGAVHGVFGNRNPPAAAYASYSPPFHYGGPEGSYVGGQFWDGRASTLKDQAKGPFLNPKEQNNPDAKAVVQSVVHSNYGDLFKKVYGASIVGKIDAAYDAIADAIAAYEKSPEVNRFNSKFDRYLDGMVALTPLEAQGLELFNGKGRCAECHPSTVGKYSKRPLFTDFTYDNLGVPKNPKNPFYKSDPKFVDKGLGAILKDPAQDGKFKVPTLRNIAVARPYSHNGYFKSLKEIIEFYNTRDVPSAGWPKPEVAENVNRDELGNLGLTDGEIDALVAFLGTLTDGYALPFPREVKN
jgi:cytochrome c peroxidase